MSYVIEYLNYYIPRKKVLSRKILENRDIDSEQFIKETRINSVNVFEQYELPGALDNMFNEMFKSKNIELSKIKYIACETTPLTKYHNISVVHFLQKKYGLDKAKILPLHQPCAFTLCAIELSTKLLEQDEYMLILCANDWSEREVEERFLKFTIMGDGIGLVLVKNDSEEKSGIRIHEWYYENYGVSSLKTYNTKNFESEPVLNRLSMIKKGVDFITSSLKQSDISISDINKIIVSNVRYDVFRDTYSGLLGISPNVFYLNTQEGGHANDIDIIRNLKDYLETKQGEDNKEIIALYTLDIEESMDINYHLIMLNLDIKQSPISG